MRSRLRFWKYPIIVVLLLLVIAAFTFIYAWSNIAAAPHERIEQPVETPEPDDVTEEPEPGDEIEDDPTDEEPEDDPDPVDVDPEPYPEWDDFIVIEMDEADIHRGFLLLVNHDHSFAIPNDLGLVNILDTQTTNFRVQHRNSRLAGSIMEPLDEMMAEFIETTGNRAVTIRSAYRNYETQRSILNRYISQMGRREALRWAALPGYSEHHTGLAFDFGMQQSGGAVTAFTGGGSTAWFRRNSYRFGFILRYPPNKTSITQTNHEPWHFRYIGLPHSLIMNENNWVFEEYHEQIRNHTLEDPFVFEHDDTTFHIFFIEGTEVRVPLDSVFEISGNNIDGFIVTAIMLPYDPDAEIDYYV
ncbi:MAG: M15 family metallopeptidase [Oscillospiraceae bacterium]|nr:M15 family metallopeptidase [Oscillospiraceae bacterium]